MTGPENKKILIVGGGLAGLGVAKKINEAGLDFLLISEGVGGRVRTSPDGRVNYGAYYITADYRQTMPFIEKVGRMRFSNSHLHDGNKHYHIFSLRILKHLPALVRLFIDLYRFRASLRRFHRKALTHSARELIEADPLLRKYHHQQAGDYIKERRLEGLMREYLEQPLWASFFVDPALVPTALFLGSLQPLIVPSWSFVFRFDKLIAPFKDKIVSDTVVKVDKVTDGWEVVTKTGQIYRCQILVLATPMNVTNQLVAPQSVRGAIDVSFYHLRGKIKPAYDVKGYNFFAVKETAAISRESDGSYLYFYTGQDNIAKYFESWEIIAHDTWRPALFFLGDQFINEHPEPGLYVASDHNVPGIENAFIAGLYVGHLIINSEIK